MSDSNDKESSNELDVQDEEDSSEKNAQLGDQVDNFFVEDSNSGDEKNSSKVSKQTDESKMESGDIKKPNEPCGSIYHDNTSSSSRKKQDSQDDEVTTTKKHSSPVKTLPSEYTQEECKDDEKECIYPKEPRKKRKVKKSKSVKSKEVQFYGNNNASNVEKPIINAPRSSANNTFADEKAKLIHNAKMLAIRFNDMRDIHIYEHREIPNDIAPVWTDETIFNSVFAFSLFNEPPKRYDLIDKIKNRPIPKLNFDKIKRDFHKSTSENHIKLMNNISKYIKKKNIEKLNEALNSLSKELHRNF